MARWHSDPVGFAREVFGIEAWDAPSSTGRSSQRLVLEAVARHHRVSCRSGHKIGKSTSAAILGYWWTATRPGGRVLMTAPSFTQVKKILWREVRRLGAIARERLGVPEVPMDPSTGVNWNDGREIFGLSTNTPERLGGFSGGHLLIIIDEASGYPDDFYHALIGNTAGGSEDDPSAEAKIVKFGNPTQTSGHFYDDFKLGRTNVSCHHVSSEDTPNVREGRIVVPGLATQHYLDDVLEECGGDPNHPLYLVRARGDFPEQGDNSVIAVSLVEAARARWIDAGASDWEPSRGSRLYVGVDVARFGDDTSVVACRHRGHIYPLATAVKADEEAVARMVIDQCKRYHIRGLRRPLVKVDVGGGGYAVATELRHAKTESGDPAVDVVNVDSAEEANDPDRFRNKRSELWFAMADWLRDGEVEIPDDGKLVAEMVAPTFTFDDQGRRVVERKKDFKKRLRRSPDRADAVALCIYTPASGVELNASTGSQDNYRWGGARGRGFG